MKKFIPALIVLLILATSATADSPPRLIYNGYLLDDSGEPVSDGSYTLQFAFWDSESGGSQHYTESVTVTTESGFFAAPLYPSPEELPPAGEAWLEVSVNGETTDRQMVGSVPYALTASTAITASTSTETDEYTLSDLMNDEECMSDCIPQWSFADSSWGWTGSERLSVPIGSIIAWHGDLSGVPSLPSGWMECDGSTVDDADSPLDGVTLPDLNSDTRDGSTSSGMFLRGGSTSGTLEEDATAANGLGLRYGAGGGQASVQRYSNAPRTSQSFISSADSETRPANMTVRWIMRIK